MREFMRKSQPWAAVLVVSALVSACGDDDPSTPDFTAESADQMADAAASVMGPIDANEAVGLSLGNAFGALVGMGGGGTLSAMLPFDAAARVAGSPLTALRSMRTQVPAAMTAASAASMAGVLIPEEVLGTTFVWSAEGGYVASEQAGAPSDGVRFIYYAVDPIFGGPVQPLNALGHIDFVDASTASAARLEVQVVRDQGNLTLVDYFVQGGIVGNLQTTTVTLGSEGFVTDGSEQVDFDFSWVLEAGETTSTSTTDMLIENDSENASLHVAFEAFDAEASGTQSGAFTVRQGSNTAVFDIDGEYAIVGETYVGSVEGSLSFNGADVVIFSGDEEGPEFTRPDGSALTSLEIDALQRMWEMFWATQAFGYGILLPFFFLLAFTGA